MVAVSRERVRNSTSSAINRRIDLQTQARIATLSKQPAGVQRRLAELDREWDIERAIQLNSSVLTLAGLALTALVNKRWIALPIAVQVFLLQHALQGWCPPVPILRRMGFRTESEIEAERRKILQIQADRPVRRQQQDPVLEASEQSFPASDPPSWTRTSATPIGGADR